MHGTSLSIEKDESIPPMKTMCPGKGKCEYGMVMDKGEGRENSGFEE